MSTSDYLKITFSDQENVITEHKRPLPFANSSIIYKSRIIDARQLTSGSDVKHTYNIALGLQNVEYEFQPGDTIGILPENDESEVNEIMERLLLTNLARKVYNLEIITETSKKNPVIPQHIPKESTLFDIFLKHLDIRTPPKKLFLKMLVRFTTEKNEIEKLYQLTTPSSSPQYIEFIQSHYSLLTVLAAFPSSQPPIERILEYLGPLQPRPYSICASPLTKQLRVTFSLIELGVCSRWLEKMINSSSLSEAFTKLDLHSDRYLSFYFRKINHFRLPQDPAIPIIMIGPGTGVAPFIGFLEHRQIQKEKFNIEFGTSWLFYGCRYLNKDFLYKSEINKYLEKGVLTKLFSCSSRDGPNKIYVQDLIRANAKDFVEQIVANKAITYVCGDAKNMAKDVKSTITKCIEEHTRWSETETNAFVKQLQENARYIEDVWL
ncbi:hypothetical protein FQR65_LT06218 [Abscondita terminalis]|nr:hypothetical protein FQR65_LT06218 [Abscondita terminalis]